MPRARCGKPAHRCWGSEAVQPSVDTLLLRRLRDSANASLMSSAIDAATHIRWRESGGLWFRNRERRRNPFRVPLEIESLLKPKLTIVSIERAARNWCCVRAISPIRSPTDPSRSARQTRRRAPYCGPGRSQNARGPSGEADRRIHCARSCSQSHARHWRSGDEARRESGANRLREPLFRDCGLSRSPSSSTCTMRPCSWAKLTPRLIVTFD
jgi:hypothetical protein